MAELGLRMGGFGVSKQLFLKREVRGETVYTTNHHAFFQQFYTSPITVPPFDFSMPAAKPPGTYRIFVFGSSAAQGAPMPEFAFSRILDTMLQAERHGMKTEIHSLAICGSNSHVMRAAAKACAACDPDLFLIYMGNNELDPTIANAIVWDWLPPWLALQCLRLGVALNDSRLVQMLHGAANPADPDRPPKPSGGTRDPDRAYAYYRANVNDMCAFAKEAGAKVILCTVGSRLREWNPQGGHTADPGSGRTPQWTNAYDAGNAFQQQGRFQDALVAYTRAADMDSSDAGLAYRIACCRHALGEYADARQWFIRANRFDTRHCRAGDRINDILRETAAARAPDGVRLADSAQALADASPHGIEGPELFLDHVHLTFEGNYVLAQSALETLARMEPRLGVQSPPLSIEKCRLRLAMTQADLRDQLSITAGSYVFKEVQPKDILAPVLAELEAQIGTRAQHMRLEACRNAIQMNPQNELVRTKYVKLLMDTKDTNEALEQAKALAEAFPYSLEAQLLLARLFDTTGDKSRAVETLRLALEWCPDDAYPYMRLGQLLNEERRPEAALAAFRASFRLKPSAQAQSEIARILLSQDDISGAVNAYRHSLDLEPRNADVFEGLVLALCASDRLAEANGEMERWCAAACEKGNRITSLYKNNRQAQNPAARPMKDKALGARMSLLHELSEILPNGSDSVSKFQQFLRDKGGRMEAAGNLQGAINTYREAINIDPQNHGFILDLDKTLSTDQPADRRTLWETVRADNPGNARVTELCATARAAAGDMAGARQLLQTLPDNPVSTATFQSLFLKEAERLKGVGDPAGAVRACREAILLDPQNGQAIQLLDQALPKNSPTERRAAWESIWREKPDNPQVTAYCGVARAAAGDIAGAKQLFQALPDKPRSAPEFQEAFMDEGGRREAAGDLPGAISAYREAIPLAPRNDQPVERLEKVLSTGSPANRRGIWEAVWRENPDSPRVAARCGIARAAAGDIAGAKQLFQTLPDRLSFSTQFQGAFMDEGARREAAGDLPGAVDAYREAIPLYPENNQPVLLLEKAQMKCGPAERRSVWEAVWGDNLDNPHVAVFCGVARAATGDIAGAKSAFDAASRLMPGQWHFCELAADALADAGAWDDAVAAYACALALNPHLDYLLDRLHAAAKCAAENVHALENTAPSPAGQ